MFDYNRKKVCDLYDSSTNALGQAYGITYSEELNGWKEVSFTLPLMVNGEKNFRWNYIRNEYKLRLTIGQSTDWFVIQKPKRSKNGKTITNVVTCPHESTMLKKKNIYLTFDDENGIDSIENLINKALINTGWTIGVCDTFLENDGSKEKIRSIKSDGKQGTYGLITEICNLFNAYPVYHGDTRKVDIHALGNKEALSEMMVGKNLDTLTVEQNSENIVTRLYVEGEYGDDGYVGIDSANPTGLPFLLNFDYYKEIGVFTQEHQAALDQYLADIAQAKAQVSTLMQQMIEKEDQLNALIGQPNYVLYVLNQGQITAIKRGGDAKEEDEQISLDDKLIIIKSASSYRTVSVTSVPFLFEQTDIYAFKFLTPSAGTIGAKETAIEAKQKMIDQLRKEIAKDEDDPDNPRRSEDIASYQTEIAAIYAGSADVTGLYQLMYDAAVLGYQIYQLEQQYETASDGQAEIEQAFHLAMGDLLNDGYWSDTNYVVGQEVNLYNDAVDVLKQLSKPSVTYSISLVTLSELMDMKPDNFVLNGKIRLYDPDIPINDFVYITKIVHYLDDPKKDTVDISNTDITLTGQGYSSVMSRITELADMVDQKNSMYSRAAAFDSTGKMDMDRLNGVIDVLKNRLTSSSSSWYTDDNGNIIFESADGTSAMMLCGEGFCIAAGKTDEGEWNWRTFGTGQGFTADLITTGTLSANVIDVENMNLESNLSLQAMQGELVLQIEAVDGAASKLRADLEELSTAVQNSDGKFTQFVESFDQFMLTVGDTLDGLTKYMRFDENGLTIGDGDDTAKFVADQRTLSVTNVSTERVEITQSIEEQAEWAWTATGTGLGLKYVGPQQ